MKIVRVPKPIVYDMDIVPNVKLITPFPEGYVRVKGENPNSR